MSARNAKRADRRDLKQLARDFPSWTITYSGCGPRWEAARERHGAAITLTASTAWELGVMIVAARQPASDDTGTVPVVKVLFGGEST